MQKLKSNLQNMVGVLVIVAVLSGGILAFVYGATKPAVDAQAELALADGIKAVLAADEVKVQDQKEVKRTINGKEQTFVVYTTDKGTAVQSTDPNGFGGNLKVLVGFDAEGNILGYTVLEHAETPGLGAKAPEWFQKGQKGDIIGKNPGKDNMTVSKDGGDIDAITASTITSRAFLRAVQQAYNTYAETPETDANTSATQQASKQECGHHCEGGACEKMEGCGKHEGCEKMEGCGKHEGCEKEQGDCCKKMQGNCEKEQMDCCKNKK